ncbi:MAG: alpha/beta hydrolase [Pirellulales bacterium]
MRWSFLFGLIIAVASSVTVRADEQLENLPFKFRADVVYGHKDGMALTYDVIEPKENAKGVGLMLMVSGGWVSAWMPPTAEINFVRPFLDAGYTVIAVRHGSAPRYVVPEAVADVRLALRHVSSHAESLHIDPNRIGVFGFSAGGHLSCMLGTTSNDKKAGPHVAAVAAVFPPTDLEPYVKDTKLQEQFPALKFDASKAVDSSPLRHASSDDAPTLFVHGDKDELVPLWHSEKLDAALTGVNVPSKLVVVPGAGHGFDAAGNKIMVDNMLAWFDKHLAADKPAAADAGK